MIKKKQFSIFAIFVLSMLLSCPIWSQEQIEVVNIETPELQAYLADSTYYYDDDFSNSIVTKYIGSGKQVYSRGLDYPQGKNVTWTPSASFSEIDEVRITVSNNMDFSDATTFVPPMERQIKSYEIRNNFPNRIYYYKVEEFLKDGSVNVVAKGMYRTVGQVRMIRVRGAHNVRDLGGWPTQFGVPIKYGYLYRSGNLDKVTREGIHDFVDNLNVCAELDLRGGLKGEHTPGSSPLGRDVDYKQIANDSYVGAMQSQGSVYVRDLEWIIARLREGKSVDWHCAVGCDRCGTLSFLIGGLLGMSAVDLTRDYELSSFRGYKRYRSHVGFRKMIPYIKKFGPEDDLAQCFYNYWTKNGLSPEDIDYLRTLMLGKGYNLPTRRNVDIDNIAKYHASNAQYETDKFGSRVMGTGNDGTDSHTVDVEMPVKAKSSASDVPPRTATKTAPANQPVPERPKQPAAASPQVVPEKPAMPAASTAKNASEETSKSDSKSEKQKALKKDNGKDKNKNKDKDNKSASKSQKKDDDTPKSNLRPTVTKVSEGESLSKVAKRLGCTVEALMKANGITDENDVKEGDRLKVPRK